MYPDCFSVLAFSVSSEQNINRKSNKIIMNYGLAVASPYVGMAGKQDGGSNQCISVFTVISSPENKCYRLKLHRAANGARLSLQ